MTDTIASIKGRSLNKTGVTEALARQYANQLGTEHIAIVRYGPDSLITDADGHQKVLIAINSFEPVVEEGNGVDAEDLVRNLERALAFNRGLADGQRTIDEELDGPAPKVSDFVERGEAILEKDEDGEPRLWDGNTDPAAEQPELDEPDEPVEPEDHFDPFAPNPSDEE